MLEFWNLLLLSAAIGAGLIAATICALLVRSRRSVFYRYFLVQILLLNLLTLCGLAIRMIQYTNSGPDGLHAMFPLLFLFAVLAVLKLGWIYIFLAMVLVLLKRPPTQLFAMRFAAGGAALLAAILIWLVLGILGRIGLAVIEVLTIVLPLAASCVLIWCRGSLAAGRHRRAVMALASSYIGLLCAALASLIHGWTAAGGQSPSHLLVNSLLLLLFNLLPLPWVLRIESGVPLLVVPELGLTPREQEIAALIGGGLTNKEIAEKLFISIATVKDHNHNIFRKTRVRNRVELSNLLRAADCSTPQG